MGGILPPAERRSSALVGLYAALSLLLLLSGERIPATALRAIGAWIFAPLDRVVLAGDRLASAWRENQALHERIARLEMENQRLRGAGAENAELRRILGLPLWQESQARPAEVLALAGGPIPTSATLSVGRRQGVKEGDVVVTDEGLLGRVGEAYPGLSRAILITDPNSAVACEIESTAVLGVLRRVSVPNPRLVLTGVPLADTVLVGQRVLTSGMSRLYPRGIPVGAVARVGSAPGSITQDIEVVSAASLSRLRHAFVLPSLSPATPGAKP